MGANTQRIKQAKRREEESKQFKKEGKAAKNGKKQRQFKQVETVVVRYNYADPNEQLRAAIEAAKNVRCEWHGAAMEWEAKDRPYKIPVQAIDPIFDALEELLNILEAGEEPRVWNSNGEINVQLKAEEVIKAEEEV